MSTQRLGRNQLCGIFRDAEKSPAQFRIGAEAEKFGVERSTGRPLGYGGDFSVCQVLESLNRDHGWEPIREVSGGPVLALQRGQASVTLEPSVQLELSGAALEDLHLIQEETDQHLRELRPVSEAMNVAWLATGFHPLCRLDELGWVPKQRYPIMREYLPKMGAGGLDMMQRTCTTQGNFDWENEGDAMKKMVVALKLSPLLHAWFANAPFKEGASSGTLSHRGHVWRHMDPSRSGLIERFWQTDEPRYDDYIEWALDAGMFLIRREDELVRNTGQTFRDYMEHGYLGHQATEADWKLHLHTLFPEVRLKNTLEVRSVDALPPHLALAALAVWTGVLYDDQALDQARALVESFGFSAVEGARVELCDRGLHATLCGKVAFEWAEQLLVIAHGGLSRRARLSAQGRDEAMYLGPAAEILETRVLPAERLLHRVAAGESPISATTIPLPL